MSALLALSSLVGRYNPIVMNRQVALGFGLGVLTTSVLIGCLTAQRPANPRSQTSPTATPTAGVRGQGVPEFWVRPGYRVDLVAENLGNARFMEFDDKGNLYLSRPNRGDILTLRWRGNRYEIVNTFVAGYPTVHGMHFAEGWLWFTQTGAIHKARDTNGDGKADEVQTVIPEGQLPRGGGHWWRPILVTDRYLYTGIGDSGNINDETETERQKIWRFNKDGTGKTLFASGIRNTEKLRLRPGTNEIWGVDHGSDWFGRTLGERPLQFQPITDYNPPDELNHYEEGKFYGHPFITGNKLPRIEYQNRKDIVELADKTVPPAWSFGAHWAANSFTFLTKDHFPGHKGDMFVACRGSWNRTIPDGYRIERVLFDPVTGRPYGSLTIVKTLVGNRVLARPVDCVEAPDGSVLFSCDTTNRIYRISWVGDRNARSN